MSRPDCIRQYFVLLESRIHPKGRIGGKSFAARDALAKLIAVADVLGGGDRGEATSSDTEKKAVAPETFTKITESIDFVKANAPQERAKASAEALLALDLAGLSTECREKALSIYSAHPARRLKTLFEVYQECGLKCPDMDTASKLGDVQPSEALPLLIENCEGSAADSIFAKHPELRLQMPMGDYMLFHHLFEQLKKRLANDGSEKAKGAWTQVVTEWIPMLLEATASSEYKKSIGP